MLLPLHASCVCVYTCLLSFVSTTNGSKEASSLIACAADADLDQAPVGTGLQQS
jgi:hypothetical protein